MKAGVVHDDGGEGETEGQVSGFNGVWALCFVVAVCMCILVGVQSLGVETSL